MTRDEYYKKVREKLDQTNFDDLASIKEFARYCRELQKQITDKLPAKRIN